MSLSQNGNCYYRSDFRPCTVNRDIWFKTRFIRSKQSKTEWRKRVLTIKNQALNYTFPTHFTEKPVIDASKPRQKRLLSVKEVTLAKWQMPCILPVLM
jgi:hypothetical protein